jgi:hypothetical protein
MAEDLQKQLALATEGIMIPSTVMNKLAPKKVTTATSYDMNTNSLMTNIKPIEDSFKPVGTYNPSEVFKGPAVIRYGADGQRNLVEPDSGMLAGSPFKFSIDPITGMEKPLPKPGEGIVEDVSPTPPITTPVEPKQPTFDPCPTGFKFDPRLQRCVKIEEDKGDREDNVVINKPRNRGATAKATGYITDAIDKLPGERGEKLAGTYGKDVNLTIDNTSALAMFGSVGKVLDEAFVKGPADKRLLEFGKFVDVPGILDEKGNVKGITVTKNANGTLNAKFTEEGKYNFGLIQTNESLRGNLASTQKTDKSRGGPGNVIMGPNNTPMIVGPISVNSFGKTSKEFLTPEQVEKNRKAVEDAQKRRDNLKLTTVTTRPSLVGQTKDTSKDAREFKKIYGKQKSQQQLKQERDQIESDLDNLLKKNITEADRQAAKKTTGSSANKKDKGKIVCTMMNESYGFGSFRNKIWLAQSRNLAKEYEIGYHTLFLPLVKYAKQKGFINNIVKKVLEHIAIHRTIDIRKQKYNKLDILGRTYRTILEPLCYITGGIKTWKKK